MEFPEKLYWVYTDAHPNKDDMFDVIELTKMKLEDLSEYNKEECKDDYHYYITPSSKHKLVHRSDVSEFRIEADDGCSRNEYMSKTHWGAKDIATGLIEQEIFINKVNIIRLEKKLQKLRRR